MLLDLVVWSFLIVLIPLALDLALQLTGAIARAFDSILSEPSERQHNSDRLASQSWSQPTSR
jgi:uncharacterized protein involved in cysteine biosynthesis